MCNFQQLFFLFLLNSLLTGTFVEGKDSPHGQDGCRFEDQNFQTEFLLNVIKENKLENLREEYEQYKKQSTLYTGFVIEKQYEYQVAPFRINNFLKVTFCKGGKRVWYETLPSQEDLDWTEPLCVSPVENDAMSQNRSTCFKFARVQKYTQRNVTLYFPNKLVGFLFVCNSSEESSSTKEPYETIPLTPIISDNIRDYKTSWTSKGTVTKVVPYLHTLSIPMAKYETLVAPDNCQPEELENKSLNSEFLRGYKSLGKFRNKGISWLNEIDPMEKYESLDSENVRNFREKLDKTLNKIGQKIEKPHAALMRAINGRSGDPNNRGMTRRKYLKKKISKMLRNKIPLKS
ncbi:YGL138C-like protein [Saccharomyces cerevisiae x Saccharomyces kudriavzevii VIN7]|uniref:YGL138C-like protein n=1 Tax=Saccharomyces cerevisiae x Saccharomyces kudriavzevii (strain VIN7) TaxID=1095631 RepID=H0GUN5_SACCK|nr:YGL138C-like protein [Saccharomyces cerevisiae x Saccharomyces kudriavzevii VIN7]